MIVTKGIVELHGGKIYVHSDGEGCGSTFTVELPVYKRHRIFNRDGSVKSLFIYSAGSGSGSFEHLPPLPDKPFSNVKVLSLPSRSRSHSRRQSSSTSSTHSSYRKLVSTDSDGYFWDGDHQMGKSRLAMFGGATSSSSGTGMQGSPLVTPAPRSLGDDCIEQQYDQRPSRFPAFSTIPETSEMSDSFFIPNKLESSTHPSVVEGLRVLIVDDTSVNRKMMSRLLKQRCDVTMEAEDGQRAVEEVASAIARGEPFNCILMDFNMPRKDGPTAAREIRSLGYTGIIIGITGCTTPAEKELFVSSGANCVLTKPVDLMELDRTIIGMLFNSMASSFVTTVYAFIFQNYYHNYPLWKNSSFKYSCCVKYKSKQYLQNLTHYMRFRLFMYLFGFLHSVIVSFYI